jgi:hypothetical protein
LRKKRSLESPFKGLDTSCSRCCCIGWLIRRIKFASEKRSVTRSARISGVWGSDSHSTGGRQKTPKLFWELIILGFLNGGIPRVIMRLVRAFADISANGGGAGNTGNGHEHHVIYLLLSPSFIEAIESTSYQYRYNHLICDDWILGKARIRSGVEMNSYWMNWHIPPLLRDTVALGRAGKLQDRRAKEYSLTSKCTRLEHEYILQYLTLD